jgi:UDP-N-acetylglucosamine--N-acetylmuramyl-(pentapeptide) pyrophosphoryl-undecaprenol N-acetylglucosamine transferase
VTNLLVASAGGHLQQLSLLLPRLGDARDEAIWLTYDVPQTRSLLTGETLIGAHHPTTKHLPNAVRNYRLARAIFTKHAIDRVVSTGAAVAVPVMLRARQLGIPCHYIESATRVEGPSLTGRLLERLGGVHLYRQTGDWGSPHWRQGPCVFDGYETTATEAPPLARIVVSLGTHHFAFRRLVERLRIILPASASGVLWQLGSTPPRPDLPGRSVPHLPATELQAAIAGADVVVGHAGVGLTLTALSAGKVPVLVPRRRSRHEHTDDHQVQLARELDRRGLAVVAEVGELTGEHLQAAAARTVTYREPPPFELGG